MEIAAKLILHTKEVLNTYLSTFTGQPIEKIRTDTDRDFYMTPDDAVAYGIIDSIIPHKKMLPNPKIPSLRVPPPLSIYDLGVVTSKSSSSDRRALTEKKTWS